MGTLGKCLTDARAGKGLGLHDAAHQTRISIAYLKALEEEDFSKLPGDVFVRGFLKNYAKFLGLPEGDVIEKYRELNCRTSSVDSGRKQEEPCASKADHQKPFQITLEPLLWGLAISASIGLFLFLAQPDKSGSAVDPRGDYRNNELATGLSSSAPLVKSDKLYLKIEALSDAWFLVRMDAGTQKKNILKKGEYVIWTADERFLVSLGSIESVKLYLNDQELVADIPKNTVVRDLMITEAGILLPKPAPIQQAQPISRPARRVAATGEVQSGISSGPELTRSSNNAVPAPAEIPQPTELQPAQ